MENEIPKLNGKGIQKRIMEKVNENRKGKRKK